MPRFDFMVYDNRSQMHYSMKGFQKYNFEAAKLFRYTLKTATYAAKK